jgi:hypothetical protein
LLSSGAGALGSLTALAKELSAGQPNAVQLVALTSVLFSVVALGALKLAQSRYKDAKDDHRDSPRDLRGCLHVIHRIIAGHKRVQAPPEGWLRITIHRVLDNGNELEQIVPYIGAHDTKPSSAGRRFSIHAGLIGRVAREGKISAYTRPQDMNFEEWQRWLVEHTAMTPSQAAQTRPDRFDFLGMPIRDPEGNVAGVLYLDSQRPKFFDAPTVAIVAHGCAGLAKWIDERYYRK